MAAARRRPGREKGHVERIAEALQKLQDAQTELEAVDLRTIRGDLRDGVKAAREATGAAARETATALRAAPAHSVSSAIAAVG